MIFPGLVLFRWDAPLFFAKLYFPSSDPLVGTLQAFGIYADSHGNFERDAL